MSGNTYILGIESSCDECAAAIIKNGNEILSSVVATQIEDHKAFNGVVPELASRLHTELILPVVKEALGKAGIDKSELTAVAVTEKPGLLGSLLVGVNFARSFSYALNIPLIGIDHILAHIAASQLERCLEYPYLTLLVSGGHTLIAIAESPSKIKVLGATVDDAIGEAYDKIAKAYNFGYPGGIYIDRLAKNGDSSAFDFPYPHLKNPYRTLDMSFSGLKSAVINQSEHFRKGERTDENIAASFQKCAIDYIVSKVDEALKLTGITRLSAGGGVSANSYLRERLLGFKEKGIDVVLPPLKLCGDNGIMIAFLASELYKSGNYDKVIDAKSRQSDYKGYLNKARASV